MKVGDGTEQSAKVEGAVAIVTGGARGIGRAIVKTLAQRKYRCVINYLSSEQAANSLCHELAEVGVEAITQRADVRDPSAVEAMRDAITSLGWGDVRVLVNNAGIISDAFLHKMDFDAWKRVIDTNLTGSFNCCRAFVPAMRDRGEGRIINIASFVALGGNLGQSNYVASKAGIIGMTKAMALEVAQLGITVNAVAPGFIETDMLAGIPEKVRVKLLERVPLHRFGKAEEVAEAVAYLASPAADYVTGHVLSVNGGIYM